MHLRGRELQPQAAQRLLELAGRYESRVVVVEDLEEQQHVLQRREAARQPDTQKTIETVIIQPDRTRQRSRVDEALCPGRTYRLAKILCTVGCRETSSGVRWGKAGACSSPSAQAGSCARLRFRLRPAVLPRPSVLAGAVMPREWSGGRREGEEDDGPGCCTETVRGRVGADSPRVGDVSSSWWPGRSMVGAEVGREGGSWEACADSAGGGWPITCRM